MDQNRILKIGLVFTLDYEIHGNGNGEFENWAYFPTTQMLDVFEEYGAKLTIMAEMGHYWAMKRYGELFSRDIYLFESQLKNAIERGHDVQLHFHPQWIDAKFEDGSWKLNFSRKTIERLCHNYEEAYYYLKKGKDELQELLNPINPQYQCICFRAGFLQMQPSQNMIRALTDSGFISDSSVSKGMKVDDSLRLVDYSSAYSKYRPWKASSSEICQRDDTSKIYEFPLLSYSTGFLDKTIKKLSKLKKEKSINDIISGFMSIYGKGMMPTYRTVSFLDSLKSKFSKRWYYADFCQRDYSELAKYTKMVIADSKKNRDYNYVPVVMIGHSKDFFFANNLSSFFKLCKKIEEVEFISYSDAVRKMTENNEK